LQDIGTRISKVHKDENQTEENKIRVKKEWKKK
jgi:hypothetical protein